jgi:hypothetical protein
VKSLNGGAMLRCIYPDSDRVSNERTAHVRPLASRSRRYAQENLGSHLPCLGRRHLKERLSFRGAAIRSWDRSSDHNHLCRSLFIARCSYLCSLWERLNP